MKISQIEIKNFRSIQEARISFSDFNVCVGRNNTGKSNFFAAVDWFFSGPRAGQSIDQLHFGKDPANSIVVDVHFIGAQSGMGSMLNKKNQPKIEKALGGADSIVVRRKSDEPRKRYFVIDGTEQAPGTGFDSALNDFLPRFELVGTRQYFDDVAKFGKTTPVGVMLSGVLDDLLSSSKAYREFRDKFEELFESAGSEVRVELDRMGHEIKECLFRQFEEANQVKFEVGQPQFADLLKGLDIAVDDGILTLASEKGDGMQRALMLAIIQAYAAHRKQNADKGKSFLFFVDEAELHLHPTAQRQLKDVLVELSKDRDQVFVNTHSSVLISDGHDGQSIIQAEKDNGMTLFKPVEEMDKPYLVYELLGGNPSDLLLPRNFLLVEGESEQIFIREIIRRFFANEPTIQVVPARGDTDQARRTINAMQRIFDPLYRTAYERSLQLLLDKPSTNGQAGFDKFKVEFNSLFTNGQVHVLDVGSLEEAYPNRNAWRKTEIQVKKMSGKQKKALAKKVGESIMQAEFKSEMPVVYKALNSALRNAL